MVGLKILLFELLTIRIVRMKFICSNISRAAIRHGGAILIKTSYLNQKNILSSMDGFGV
jgi:hypothetical protein